jgi:hypothetical protein
MYRRQLLRALPVAGTLSLAGCLDGARSTVGASPEVSTLESDRASPPLMWLFDELDAGTVPGGEEVELLAVGSGEDAHWVTVAADSEDPVETTVSIEVADEVLYETTVSVSNTAYLGTRFAFAARYRIHVRSDRHETTVEVPEERIDCNDSNLAVLLARDGSVRARGATTEMAC